MTAFAVERDDANHDDALLLARIGTALASNTGAAITGWLGAILVAAAFWRPPTMLGITLWIAALAVTHGARIAAEIAFRRGRPARWPPGRWGLVATAANGATGIVCGAGCLWLIGEGDPHELTLLCCFVMAIGVASFACIAYWPAHAALHVPTFALTAAGFFRLGDLDSVYTGLGALLLCGFVLWLGRSMGRSIVLSMRLSIENQQMAEQLRAHAVALERANRELIELSATDPLTGLANRRRLEAVLSGEWQGTQHGGRSIALLIIDVDHFKSYNDRFGHGAGDDCLQMVAEVLRRSVRQGIDLPARYGGEEFAVVLPGADLTAAGAIAERIREGVAALDTLLPGPLRKVTVSVGVAAATPVAGSTHVALMAAADRALYLAKADGRDAIRAASVEPALHAVPGGQPGLGGGATAAPPSK